MAIGLLENASVGMWRDATEKVVRIIDDTQGNSISVMLYGIDCWASFEWARYVCVYFVLCVLLLGTQYNLRK